MLNYLGLTFPYTVFWRGKMSNSLTKLSITSYAVRSGFTSIFCILLNLLLFKLCGSDVRFNSMGKYIKPDSVKIPLTGSGFPPSAPHLLTGSQLQLAGLFPLGGIAQALYGPVSPEICMH